MDTLTQQNLCLLAVVSVLLPLLSFLSLLVPGKLLNWGWFPILNIGLSFLISILLFYKVWNGLVIQEQITWFIIGTTTFKAGILLNNLSVLMLLLVSFIALLVHIYSTKYMQGDKYLNRYWSYLGLFCFSMLGLVLADNLLTVYIFWELVGFSSYLLIGFWFTREAAIQANKKAFLINRLGDLGFLAAIMIVFSQFGTLDLNVLFGKNGLVETAIAEEGLWISGIHTMPEVWLTFAGLAFFFGAIAKSAQFPLHTWLPDAMEGPTSVSSLIHAATMVAAGVFLLARVYPIFNQEVLLVIASIGVFTAFMAASIALTQNDIKRILAFSTISQLGFMMIALGTGAYTSALFHLVTHAFFKCLLFLAAGAVIHEMYHLKQKLQLDFDHQDIRNMGGLWKAMPVTFITIILASLALVGIPLSSGYLSKDAILIQTFEWADLQGGPAIFIPYLGMITSWITAFYIARLVFKVFFGTLRIDKSIPANQMHEAPAAMKYVLIILALFCIFPVFSINPFAFEHSWIMEGLEQKSIVQQSGYHTIIPLVASIGSILIILLAYRWYVKRERAPDFSGNFVYRFAANQWYFDKFYNTAFVSSILFISKNAFSFDKKIIDGFINLLAKMGVGLSIISNWADIYIVDALVNGVASLAKTIGNFARYFQTGRLQHYLLTMVILVLTFFLVKYLSQTI